jgi:hypothetical protein
MAIVKVIQPPVDQETYDAVSAKIDAQGDPPDGLILHCAGSANGKWQVIEVWESEEQSKRFEEQRLGPAISDVRGPDAPSRDEVTMTSYELHNLITP